MGKRMMLAALGVLLGAVLMVMPAAAVADGGPYSFHQVTNANGTPEQFETGLQGSCPGGWYNIAHRWYSGGSWSAWSNMGGCTNGFDVGMNSGGRLELFGLGSDLAVWHKWQTQPSSGPWSNWYSLGGTFHGSAPWTGSEFSGQPNMHVYGNSQPFGPRWVNYQTSPGCCWSGWFQG